MKDLLQVVNDSPFALYTCDKDGYLTFFNDTAAMLWGREPELGKDRWVGAWKLFYPDGRPMAVEDSPIAMTLKTGTAQENQSLTIQRYDGAFRQLRVFARPLFNEDGTLSGAHNTLVDVSATQHLDTKHSVLSAIVESSDDAIISKDLNGIIRSWNEGASRIFGYTEKEAVGQHITLLIPESRLPEEEYIINRIRQGQKVDHFQTKRIHKEGHEIDISLTVSPVKNANGETVGASKIARDITQHVQSQNVIARYGENLKTLNDIGKLISEKMDVNVILQRVTDATTKITGAAFGAFFYNTVNELGESYMLYTLSGAPRSAFDKFGMPRNTEVFAPTFAGEGIVRVDDITKDPRYGHNAPHHGMPKGHLPVVSYLAVPVISESGAVIGGLFFGHPEAGMFTAEHEEIISNIAVQTAIAIDNSRLFEEVKTLSARKDEFIALASHELKTPLTSIKGYLQVLARGKRNEMEQRFFDKSLRQIDRLSDLVEEMLNMSRITAGKLDLYIETFDLRELLLDVIDTFRHTDVTHGIVEEISSAPVIISGDRQRLEQVLINLVSNAVKYSPKADSIKVVLKSDNLHAIVKVEDYGIGLTPEQQQKVFTRFYRAEGTEGMSGLGLGLYLAKEILDRHHTELKLTSELGKGSVFYFNLPLA